MAIADEGALAVIPNNPSRVATRYEKTAWNSLAVVTIAAIVLWVR